MTTNQPSASVSVSVGELIERVQAATGPDREIDCAVALVSGKFFIHGATYDGEPNYCFHDERGGIVSPGHGGDQMVPRYTASLDAVLALVGEKLPGWSWIVRQSGFGTPSQAEVYDPMKSPGQSYRGEVNSTPALALLSALLHAMEADHALG